MHVYYDALVIRHIIIMPRVKGNFWRVFNKVPNSIDTFMCKYCGKIFKKNATRMRNHVENKCENRSFCTNQDSIEVVDWRCADKSGETEAHASIQYNVDNPLLELEDADLQDRRYGITKEQLSNDKPAYHVGKHVIIVGEKKICLGDKEFKTTPGLILLLTKVKRSQLQSFTQEDLENYKSILEISGNHLNRQGKLKNYRDFKTQFIIRPLFTVEASSLADSNSNPYTTINREIRDKSALVDVINNIQGKRKRLLHDEHDYQLAMEKKFKPLIRAMSTDIEQPKIAGENPPVDGSASLSDCDKNDSSRSHFSDKDRDYFLNSVKCEMDENLCRNARDSYKTKDESRNDHDNDDEDDGNEEKDEDIDGDGADQDQSDGDVYDDDDKSETNLASDDNASNITPISDDRGSRLSRKCTTPHRERRYPQRDQSAPNRYRYEKLGGRYSNNPWWTDAGSNDGTNLGVENVIRGLCPSLRKLFTPNARTFYWMRR